MEAVILLLIVVGFAVVVAIQIVFHRQNKNDVPAASVPAESPELKNLREENTRLIGEKSHFQSLAGTLQFDKNQLSRKVDELQETLRERDSEVAGTRAKLTAQEEKFAALKAEQEKLSAQMKTQFENIATKIFDEHSQKFKTLNSQELSHLTKPFQENLAALQKKIDDSFGQERELAGTLQGKIETLVNRTNTISEDAKNLTNALRGNSKVQGDWGEMLLVNALEFAGLTNGVAFRTQQKVDEVEGQERGRTDVELVFPGNRVVVVDAKISLKSYMDYCSAADEKSRGNAAKAYLDSVKKHIDELGGKYAKVKNSADFVLMFVHNEAAYMLANALDRELWQYAQKRKVVVVSAAHLLAVAQLLAQLWQQDTRIKNVEKIQSEAQKMADKLNGLLEDFEKVGKAIGKAQEAFDSTQIKIRGKDNILRIAERMSALGVPAKGKLSAEIELLPDETLAIDCGNAENENREQGEESGE